MKMKRQLRKKEEGEFEIIHLIMTLRSKQFKGILDPKSAAIGIRLAYKNAEDLLMDAEILFLNKRFERSVALAILAIEEAGKCTIIRAMLLAVHQNRIKKEWQNYRRHTEKNLAWVLPELVANGANHIDDLKKVFDPESDHGVTLDNIKQLSFYTDIFGSGNWHKPSDAVDESFAKQILFIAKSIVGIDRVMTTEKELELWVKHLKPAQTLGRQRMKEALFDCYVEAEKLGIIDESKLLVLTKFLL